MELYVHLAGPFPSNEGHEEVLVNSRQPVFAWPVFRHGAGIEGPLHLRLYVHLRDAIFRGDLAEGMTLPGEFALSERFHVSRATVRRALGELANRGLISRHPGRGTLVRARSDFAPLVATIEGALERTRLISAVSKAEILEFEDVPTPTDVAKALQLDDATVCMLVLIRRMRGEPFVHFTSWVPLAVGHSLDRADLERSTMLPLLEQDRHRIIEIRQTIEAAPASRRVARSLQLSPGAPLLRVERVVVGVEGIPIEWSIALYRHDRHQYRINLQGTREPSS